MNIAVKENLKENLTKENLKQNLSEIFEDLSVESLAEVVDFAEFLREKMRKQNGTKPDKKRVGGLLKGKIWMSDDFNDELPDEFWFGEDFGLVNAKK